MLRALAFVGLTGCYSYSFMAFRLASTPDASEHMGVSALTLMKNDTIEFKSDGSAEVTRYRRVKIFTADGVRAATVHLPFNAAYRLNFFSGRVITSVPGSADRVEMVATSEGKILRPLANEGSREVGEVVLEFPNVGPGVAFDYVAIYRVPDATLIQPIVMRDRTPVDHAEVTILAPDKFELDLRFLQDGQPSATAPSRPSDAPSSGQAYRFVAVDLPPLIEEEMAPSSMRTGPVVWPLVRRGGKLHMQRWDDALAWVQQRFKLPSPGATTTEDALRADFQKVALGLTIQDSGLRLGERQNRSGHDRIEAGLATYEALASHYNVSPALAVRAESGMVLPDAPSPSTIDAILVAYDAGGHLEYLDPSCPLCPKGQVSAALEGAPVVAAAAGGAKLETLPERQVQDNGIVFTLSGNITPHGEVTGSGTAILSGAPSSIGRAAYLQNNAATLHDALGWAKEALLIQPKAPEAPPGQTFEIGFDFSAKCVDDGGVRLRCNPQTFLQKALAEVWRESRTRDLLMPAAFSEQLVASLHLPGGKVEPPPAVAFKSKFGDYALGYKLDRDQLTITRRLSLSTRTIATDDYQAFYKFLSQVRAADASGPPIDLFTADDTTAAPAAKPATKPEPAKKKKGKH